MLRLPPGKATRFILPAATAFLFGLSTHLVLAQGDERKWEHDVPNEVFKEDQTPVDSKHPKRPRKPTRRLAPAPANCPECATLVEQLQAVLDDFFAMQLAQAEADLLVARGGNAPAGAPKEPAAKAQRDEALTGLGQPADGGEAARTRQRQNAEDPAKRETHRNKELLKKEIKRLSDLLQECLRRCQPPAEPAGDGTAVQPPAAQPEQPAGGVPQVGGGAPAPPPPNVAIDPLPKDCFPTQRDKDAYIDAQSKKLEKVMADLAHYIKNQADTAANRANMAQARANRDALQAAIEAADQLPICPPKAAKPKPPPKNEKTGTGGGHGMVPRKMREQFCALISEDKIKVDFVGTGETSGHVADARITNLTDKPVSCTVPPMVLQSASGKNQDYACPKPKTVEVGPKGSKTVPLEGVCLVRNKPPVGKNVSGDLKICENGSRIPDEHADKFLNIASSISRAAEKLLEDGSLKEIPYKDPEKKKDIVVQWATWADPRISELTGVPPATKEDLKKTVYKQVEEKGAMTPDTKKKVDKGIDTIFEKVELTTAKAKDLEKPDDSNPIQPGGGPINISDDTPTPGPGTQERPKKDKKDKKNKYLQEFDWWKAFTQRWPRPFANWMAKKLKADWADQWKASVANDYNQKLRDYFNRNAHYRDVKGQRDAADEKAKAAGATQADKDAFAKADSELKTLENNLKQDFNKTDEGKNAFDKMYQAENAANKAHDEEKEAGKNIDPATKEAADNYIKENPPPPELLHPEDPVHAMW